MKVGILLFEGEYLDRKKEGKGKEYFGNGNVSFEGDILNRRRNVKGKEYHYESN